MADPMKVKVFSLLNLKAPAEKVAEAVVSTIAPETWDRMGGEGVVRVLEKGSSKALVVRQTDGVHAEIKTLLIDLE